MRHFHEHIVDGIFAANSVHLVGSCDADGAAMWLACTLKGWALGEEVLGHASHPAPYCFVTCRAEDDPVVRRYAVGSLILPVPHTVRGHADALVGVVRARVPSQVRVVVLDNLQGYVKAGSFGDVGRFIGDLYRLCSDMRVTILGIVHATTRIYAPRQRIRGTVAWGVADTIILVDPDRVTVEPMNSRCEVHNRDVVRTEDEAGAR